MEETNEEFSVGSLLAYRDLTEEQKNILIDLLAVDLSSSFKILFNVIDDDFLTLELLDIFAGRKVKFPDRKKMYKLLEKIKIYTFIKSKNYSAESYKLLAKQYKKRVSQIKSTVSRVEYLLNKSKGVLENGNN